jgi:hypothetical protein
MNLGRVAVRLEELGVLELVVRFLDADGLELTGVIRRAERLAGRPLFGLLLSRLPLLLGL